jgi:catechol 2,3-dioxygenase-like lactoylglutathione lyase family enzyme
MFDINFVVLYVDSPAASARFYSDLVGAKPVQSSPTFVVLVMPSGVRLGLWSRQAVAPGASGSAGAGEIAYGVADGAAVDRVYADWTERGLRVIQTPVNLGFGRTFVALDPDGNRLRVFASSAP